MIRHLLLIPIACVTVACAGPDPLAPQSPAEFIPTNAAEGRQPILPDGVAVLHEYPDCGFEPLGEVRARNYQIEITPSRIQKLKEQAALYGADAIIVHPNLPICENGSHPPICAGRGEYVIATAIQYLDDPVTKSVKPVLEHQYKRGQDTVEMYKIDKLIEYSPE